MGFVLGLAFLPQCTPSSAPLPQFVSPDRAALSDGFRTALPSSLCVTEGALRGPRTFGNARVEDGAFRAFVRGPSSPRVEVLFAYDGPSAFEAPLANGEIRRQIGLKLRAQDTCNVVYVMWHLDAPTVAVSVKHNAEAHTHRACGANGYENVLPSFRRAPPPILRGDHHTLTASIDETTTTLTVLADHAMVWRGVLPATAFAFDGPVGLRADNGAFDFEMHVPESHSSSGLCR